MGAVFAIMTKAVIDAAEPEPLEVLGDLTGLLMLWPKHSIESE
ncbi:MAG: hypothetical protein R2709_12820 [Marmoricola sp.]